MHTYRSATEIASHALEETVAPQIAGMDEGTFVLVVVGGTLGFIVLSFVFAALLFRRIIGGSKKKRAAAKRLVETGRKARATILSINPTGLVMNEIYIQCRIRVRMDPLDGGAAFTGEKKAYISQTNMPRVGDVWPSWYEATDPSTFTLGQPDFGDPDSVPVLAEFGIPHPLAV